MAAGKIQVFNPDSLRNEAADSAGYIEAGLANFGHIEYGSSSLGEVFVPKTNVDGCKPFAPDMFSTEAQNAIFQDKVTFELPMILLDRGNCSFVTKVRNVERAGANVALIGDNKVEDSEVFIMSDDGSGHSVNIPSFLIRKSTADAFKKAYDDSKRIIVRVNIETGKADETADVTLWYSTPFDLTVTQLEGLRDTIPAFDSRIHFQTKIRSKPCLVCSETEMKRDCLSDGLYCPLQPISPTQQIKEYYEKIPGQALMHQSLIAKCVHIANYHQSSDSAQAMRKSLDYMIDFAKNCLESGDVQKLE